MFRTIALAVLATACMSTANAQDAATDAPEDTILILDASGSMWGQIDGVNKIVIAKDVMEGLIRSIPEDRRLGLVAYGHREKGNCEDIETLADVGANRDDLVKSVRALTPRGKTPLSSSVLHAATDLNYTKNKSTVILVSDGKETCDVDPCELARVLEEKGLDFTVHVVGFDVTEEERVGLKCIADETGGTFLAANNAAELTEALNQVTAAPVPQESTPVPAQAIFHATILDGGPEILSKLNWSVTPRDGGDAIFVADNTGSAKSELPPGDYTVNVTWTGWKHGGDKNGTADFTLRSQAFSVVTVPVMLDIPVTLDAPDAVPEGDTIDVTWTGPDDLGGSVNIAEVETAPLDSIFFFNAQQARNKLEKKAKDPATLDTNGDGKFDQDDPATWQLQAPPQPGQYEIRYMLRDPVLMLARKPIEITDRAYTLEAPDEAPMSTKIEVRWTGDYTKDDIMTIVPKGDKRVFDNGNYTRVAAGKAATLTTPKEPGEYEIRYAMTAAYTTYPGMDRAVQVSRPLTVTAVTATLSAPDIAVGGSTIDVTWEGPEGFADDYITVVEAGKGDFNRESNAPVAARGTGAALNPAPIRVPAIAGDYEIVYAVNPGRQGIARIPLKIEAAEATVDAPDSVKVGEAFEVTYSGDGFKGDRVVLVKADVPDGKMWSTGVNYGFPAKAGETTGTVNGRASAAGPGEYEVRYVTGLQHQVLARDKITITE